MEALHLADNATHIALSAMLALAAICWFFLNRRRDP